VRSGIEAALRAHPKLWPDGLSVRLKEIGPQSLVLEINSYFATTDWDELTLIREEMLLDFMSVIERAGSALALPTSTVHLIDGSEREPGR